MINIEKNQEINRALRSLYELYCEDYLSVYCSIFGDSDPPCRINEFGIIDVSRYDTDSGILFVARESNDWSNADFASGCLFRSWLEDISQNGVVGKGPVQSHPNIWYNVGRWAMYLTKQERDINVLASYRSKALPGLGAIAFTNLNKVRGLEKSGRKYSKLAAADISGRLLREELKLLYPKIVVCCGTVDAFHAHAPAFSGTVINMPHPSAWTISPAEMLRRLAAQCP